MKLKSMKTFALSFFGLLIISASASGVNIAWLSYHNTDTPNAEAQPFGFTEAPGQDYVDLLRENGHTVTRFITQSPTQAYIDNLNTFDLVIASRQVGSGDYQDDPERALWHEGLTKPMMIMSGYLLRNNRLQFMSGDTIPDHGQSPVTLHAEAPNHPIFQGVTLDASGNTQFATYPINAADGMEQRGLSVVTDPIAGNGTLLATVGTSGDATFGGTLIAHWQAGDQLGAYTLAAPRMVFLSGTREDARGVIPIAGLMDLTPAGTQLFLNSVCHLATCGPPLVSGDTDGNGTVDIADFEPIRANFRKTVATRAEGDLVTNGVVDFADFREWKAAFVGAGGSLAGLDFRFGTNVPEPSALRLVLIGLWGITMKWRGKRGAGE
jgi:hypothetical protein